MRNGLGLLFLTVVLTAGCSPSAQPAGNSTSSGGGNTPGGSPVGRACSNTNACDQGYACDATQPGGACTKACLGLGDCPQDTVCLTGGDGVARCVRGCTQDVECRVADGYRCVTEGTARVCRSNGLPPASSSSLSMAGTSMVQTGSSAAGGSSSRAASASSAAGNSSSQAQATSQPVTNSSSATTASSGPVCLSPGVACTTFSQCCSGTCAGGVCGGCGATTCQNCRLNNAACNSPTECCSGVCRQGLCDACTALHDACTVSGECCNGNTCENGVCCTADPNDRDCGSGPGQTCGRDQDCLAGLRCEGGTCCDIPGPEYGHVQGEGITSCSNCCNGLGCVEYWPGLNLPYLRCCVQAGDTCSTAGDCCSGQCVNGTCCSNVGDYCSGAFECCQNQPAAVDCGGDPDPRFTTCCVGLRQSCSDSSDCCEGSCSFTDNVCCLAHGQPATAAADCCDGAALVGGKCCVGGGRFRECTNNPSRCCAPLVCKNHPGAQIPLYCDDP